MVDYDENTSHFIKKGDKCFMEKLQEALSGLNEDAIQIEGIIKKNQISTVYQPIVSLSDGEIIGYEALSRGPAGSPYERPDKLFQAAEDNNLLWELEYLCRLNAIDRAKSILQSKYLFVNIDPKVIDNDKYKTGFTRDLASTLNVNPMNIILEITERTAVEDYKKFRRAIDTYINQGYRIAIDDTGAGYSGLRMLAEVHPQFIKIDMELIRDIDKKPINQILIKTLYDFAVSTHMSMIAEGIETVDELNVLIDIGINYGQGYLLQRPTKTFAEINPIIKEMIINKKRQKEKQYFYTTGSMPIGEIARLDSSISTTTTGNIVNRMFTNNPAVYGIPVVDNGHPVGLIMRNNFYANLATQYGVAVFMNRPIRLLMNKNPLIVDYNTSLAQVSRIAIGRRDEDLYDYIIITKDGQYYGITTVKSLLEYTTQLELNKAKHSNPLTGLPGNLLIEEKLNKLVDFFEPYYVIYFDLDNFKAFNDVYGFENGDKMIIFTAEIIQECLKEYDNSSSFLGHIGGDDFVAVVFDSEIDELCRRIILNFDSRVRDFYNEHDRQNGYIKTKNRHGVEERFNFVTISIAAVSSIKHTFRSSTELGEVLSCVKKRCKQDWCSCYHIE